MASYMTDTVSTYLHQWLKVASGDRVILSQHTTAFKCKACGCNRHVGDENFTGTGVPDVLQEWVKKHRHVCTKYTNTHGVTQGTCSMCGWPYAAHEQSWFKEQPATSYIPKVPTYSEKPKSYWAGTMVPITEPKPFQGGMANVVPTVKKEQPLKIYSGRKFREIDSTVSDTEISD